MVSLSALLRGATIELRQEGGGIMGRRARREFREHKYECAWAFIESNPYTGSAHHEDIQKYAYAAHNTGYNAAIAEMERREKRNKP